MVCSMVCYFSLCARNGQMKVKNTTLKHCIFSPKDNKHTKLLRPAPMVNREMLNFYSDG